MVSPALTRILAATTCAAAVALVPTASAGATATAARAASATAARAASATPQPAPQAVVMAYFLSHDGQVIDEATGRRTPRLRLVREAVRVPVRGNREALAETAANLVMGEAGAQGHVNAWGERTVTDVTVRRDRIDVTLDGPTRHVDPGTTRLAIASVVWTITAATGSNLPVVFRSADSTVLGDVRAGVRHRRSSGTARTAELAAVWIDTPARGQVVPRGRVVMTGQACAHEATVAWRLWRGTTSVRSGVTTATIACPSRGTWSVDLGTLPAGTYRVEAWAPSPVREGADLGRAQRTFVIR